MASSLFNSQKMPAQMPNQNNPLQVMKNFKQFMQGMTPQGAKDILDQKVKNGEISQQQLESAIQQAQGILQFFK